MRLIGHLQSDADARTFCDFLYVQGIENEAERDEGQWAIWIHSDDQVASAKQHLDAFRANPRDPQFQAGSPAAKLRKAREADEAAYRKRLIDGRTAVPGARSYGFGFLTYALIVASVTVFVLSKMGDDHERLSPLFITAVTVNGNFIEWEKGLPEVRSGEIWRLVSPCIIHFGILHIVCNVMWLLDLGSMFESRLRSWYFFLFVFVTGAASNLAQYFVSGRPLFGGMSGVVYALIGYVWVRGRFDPAAGLFLDRQSMIYALVWFGLCFTGWLGPIANTAHTVGLASGALWAYIDAKRC
jgi:GlpG protein